MSEAPKSITVTDDGVTLPVLEVLTGRGFITGKSGSGKSNTASVVIEELLEAEFPIFIIDTDGEYYGLKEQYEILHVGADEDCDLKVTKRHAGKLAKLALDDEVPIILDVSAYLDPDDASELIDEVATQLFQLEKKRKKPFLLLVEEIHEYLPESSGLDDLGKTLIQVAKRGRKRGLGLCGMSQRPAAVDKDFITQCDWLVWHRLTWDNDTRVVGQILGSEAAETIQDLDDGEAFLMTDWDDMVQRVKFRRKRTFDAGATPGLDDFERPEFKSVSQDIIEELEEMGAGANVPDGAKDEMREILDTKEQRIKELEERIEILQRELEAGQDESREDPQSPANPTNSEDSTPTTTDRDTTTPPAEPKADETAVGDGGDAVRVRAEPVRPSSDPDPPDPPTHPTTGEREPRNPIWEFTQLVRYLLWWVKTQTLVGIRGLGDVIGRAILWIARRPTDTVAPRAAFWLGLATIVLVVGLLAGIIVLY